MDVNNGPINGVAGPRVRQYGIHLPGSYIVFIRDIGKIIDPVKIACYIHSQKLLKKVRNGHNSQARELQLVSFCAYWSSSYDLY
jgi:hypothetical protein